MFKKLTTSTLSLAMSLSSSLDLASQQITNHHRKVAYIAYLIGTELKLPFSARKDLLLAGAFHDVGAFSLQERIDLLAFELSRPQAHAEAGYKLLREFEPFSVAAEIIKYHHVRWSHGEGARSNGRDVPLESHILHLADRVAVLIPDQEKALGRAGAIVEEIRVKSGEWFRPELVEALLDLATKEYFWLDASSDDPLSTIEALAAMDQIELDEDAIIDFGRMFSRIIDFRSPFTATHSSGVSGVAGMLSRLAGFSAEESFLMGMAGYLHDLGKLVVPPCILEKPGALTSEELYAIRAHTYYSYRALQKVPALETVNVWGSLHHERLDGSGYPFHLTRANIPLGSRIMAVADVFTALTEDRPYRKGLKPEAAMVMVHEMAREGGLDGNIVELLNSRLLDIDEHRKEMSLIARNQYDRFSLASDRGEP